MANDNFDPGERAAATQGLRGAYEGDDFGLSGGSGDFSWVDDGYGVYKENNYSIDDLFSHYNFAEHGLKPTDMWGGGMWKVQRGEKPDLAWLPDNKFLDNNNWSTSGEFLGSEGKPTDLKDFLTDLYGKDGVSVYKTRDLTNPRKSQTVYRANGETIGQRDHKESSGWFNQNAEMLTKGAFGAVAGAGLGSLFSPGVVGGGGFSAGASGGGTGAGLSTGAATGGTGAGLGSGAAAGFGASPGYLGSLGGMLGNAVSRAGINTLVGGGDWGDFGTNLASNMIPGINISGFGEYDDLLTKSLRGAAGGYLQGGGQGALLGAASPSINQGMNKLGDYFSNAFSGTDWEQDSFGSGNFSQGAPQGGLQGVFAQNGISTGAPQGPMSTNSQMQLGAGSGNQIDWDAVLQGQQGFGNVNPQQEGQQAQSYQPSAFGVGLDTAMPDPMQMANAPAAPTSGYDEFTKQMPDALKAVLIARYPQLRGVLGGGARMSPLAAGAGALATLYTANRANKDLKKQQGQLDSLFSQNSAYSKTMREQLARKDAAAGRRSQYGPREVELQARLAQMNGQLAPQRFALANARNQNQTGMYGQLLGYADQSGLTDYAGKQLSDFFKKIGT
jgi:hypothetical protein